MAQENKESISEYNKKYYEDNKESIIEYRKQYYQYNKDLCKQYYENNREHYIELMSQWKENNPEKTRHYNRNRRARKREQMGVVHPKIEELLFKTQLGYCFMCFGDLYELNWELDHIIPISKGGLHDDSNLQLLCVSCNRSKKDKILVF